MAGATFNCTPHDRYPRFKIGTHNVWMCADCCPACLINAKWYAELGIKSVLQKVNDDLDQIHFITTGPQVRSKWNQLFFDSVRIDA